MPFILSFSFFLQEPSGASLEEVWAIIIGEAAAAAAACSPSGEGGFSLGDAGCLDLARLSLRPLNCRQVAQALSLSLSLSLTHTHTNNTYIRIFIHKDIHTD